MKQEIQEYPILPSQIVYSFLLVFFCIMMVVTNIVSSKLIKIPFFEHLSLPVGYLTYPFTFLITDIISEVWGKKYSRYVLIAGFFSNLIAFGFISLAIYLTPHEDWFQPSNLYGMKNIFDNQNAFSFTLKTSGFSFLASMMTYVISQCVDVEIYHFVKDLTKGKYMWLRNNLSTLTAQLVDSTIFITIYFYYYLGMPWQVCLSIILSGYLVRCLTSLLDTPFYYMGVFLVKYWIETWEQKIYKLKMA
jgi:uncharacterized integral membrane protein (TIGR00697 family)